MATVTPEKLQKFLDSPEFKAALKEANKKPAAEAAPDSRDGSPASATKVKGLCEKFAVIEPKVRAVTMLFALLFPKSKLDFSTFVDGITAFCSVQK